MKAKRVALYARVSTDDQTVENQLLVLRKGAELRDWKVYKEYSDNGYTGNSGRDKRPGLDDLLSDAERGKIDIIAIVALDRLSRSVKGLIDLLDNLRKRGVDLYLHQMNIGTTTAAGKLFFHVIAGFAEFERDLIIECTKAGLERARAKGKKLGRPFTIGEEKKAEVRRLRATGIGINKIAKAARVPLGRSSGFYARPHNLRPAAFDRLTWLSPPVLFRYRPRAEVDDSLPLGCPIKPR